MLDEGTDKPLEGARVRVLLSERLEDEWFSAPRFRQTLCAEGITSSGGSFSITVADVGKPYSDWVIVAQKDGWAVNSHSAPVSGVRDFIECTRPLRKVPFVVREGSSIQPFIYSTSLRLGSPHSVMGTVTDEQGKPVAGASVEAVLTYSGGGHDVGDVIVGSTAFSFLMPTTDTKGRFEIADLPSESLLALTISPPGRAKIRTATGRPGIPAGTQDLKIVLPPPVTVRGTVVDISTSRPVGGVELVARVDLRNGFESVERAICDDDGTFAFDNLPAGAARIELPSPPAIMITGKGGGLGGGPLVPPDWVGAPLSLDTHGGTAAQPLVFRVSKGALLEVQLTDAASGKPIAGALVSAFGQTHQPPRAVTNEQGAAKLRLSPGVHLLHAVADDYEDLGPAKTLRAKDGDSIHIPIALSARAEVQVEGIVVDEAGRPVAGASIRFFDRQRVPFVQTDARGHFQASVFRTESGYFAEVSKGGALEVEAALEPGRPMTIVLRPPCILMGEVRDSSGRPVPNVMVSALAPGIGGFGETTNSHGRYEIRVRRGVRYSVLVKATAGKQEAELSVEIGPDTGESLQVPPLVLREKGPASRPLTEPSTLPTTAPND